MDHIRKHYFEFRILFPITLRIEIYIYIKKRH